MWHDVLVNGDPAAQLRAAKTRYERALPRYHRAVYEALRAGLGVMEASRITGYHREHIRRIRIQGDEGKL